MSHADPLAPVPNDAPVSHRLVYLYLREHGPATKREIADATGYTLRTVRRVVHELEDADLVERGDVIDYGLRRYEWQTA